jgi:hypothetical protein
MRTKIATEVSPIKESILTLSPNRISSTFENMLDMGVAV